MLTADNTLLLVIDVQERLAPVMPDPAQLFHNLQILIKGVRVFKIPILVTEHVPEKIGQTIPELALLLKDAPVIPKVTFSCAGESALVLKISQQKRKNILLCGIETHICVYQTALDLVRLGYLVHVVADAVASRSAFNKEIGLKRMEKAGVGLTSVETVLCEILGRAEGENFREILKLIK